MNCLKNRKGREYYDSEDLKYNVDIYNKYGILKCEGEYLNGKKMENLKIIQHIVACIMNVII